MSLNLNGIDIPVGQVNNNLCQTGTNTLCAPIGFNAYNWTGPGVTGQTSQCITPGANGSYSVSLTMAGTSCSNPLLYSSFNFTPAQTSNFSYSAQPCQSSLAVPFTSTVNLNGGPPVTYSWDFNNDGVEDNTAASPTFTYPAYGTYTAQLQVSNGACLNTLSQVISIQPTPTVSISSIAPICPATCTQLLGQAYQSSASSVTTTPSYSAAPNSNISSIGASTVTSTKNVTGLTSASLTSVCLNITHSFDSDLTINLICPSGGVLLLSANNGGGGANYSNTCFNLTSTTNVNLGTAPFNAPAGYIPEGGSLSNLNGCTMNGNWQLQVIDGFNFDGGTFLNWTLNFTNVTTTTGTVAASSYTWSPNTSMTGGSSLTPTVCPTSPTIYTLSATNAANGCVATTTVQVQPAVGAPTLAVTSNSIALNCTTPVETVTVSATPTTDLTYVWNVAPATLSAGNSIATFTNAGNYICTVTNTVTNCVSTIPVAVSNNTTIPLSTASTAGILTCNNFSVALNSTLAGMNYTWSAPSGGSVVSASTQSTSANGVGDYTLTIIDPSNGCTNTTTTTVTQNTATPVLSAGSNQTLTCSTTSITLNGSVTTPSNPSLNWAGIGVCGTATNVVTEACAAGIYTLTATDPLNGCVNTSTVEVFQDIIAPALTISANSLLLTCVTLAQTTTVTSLPSSGVTYSWSALPSNQSSGGSVATFTSNGTYICTVTNTINNCTSTTQVVVTTNNTVPIINITPTQTITCAIPTAVITLTTLPTTGVSYTWTPNPFSGQGANSVVVNQANIYSVTVTDAINGCINTATSQIIANGIIPAASISATSSNSIITCSNPSVTLTATVTPSGPSYSYTWLPSGNGTAITVNSASVYTVVVLNPVNGCTTFATYNVLSNTTPPNIEANDIVMPCFSNTINVIATSTNAVSYNWTTTNGSLLTNGTSTALVGSTGVYNVTATDLTNGCVSTDLATVTQTFITGGLGANPLSGTSPLLVNFTNQSGGAYNYYWTFGDNNNNTSSATDPTHTFTATGVYVVTLLTTDATGLCSITSTITIEVLDNSLLEVPNVFTPNGDGSNEVFIIKTKGISELTCEIYNRWGLKLYTISNPLDFWDGSGYSAGTYFYIMEAKGVDGKEYKQQGFISLFK
jgi:gliding motility-associated-like protein